MDSLWSVPEPSAAPPPPPDGLVNAERITRRLQALKGALDDLPRQALRLARWRTRREAEKAPKFKSPLRPGRPPGSRRKPTHEVDEVLRVPLACLGGDEARHKLRRDLFNQECKSSVLRTNVVRGGAMLVHK